MFQDSFLHLLGLYPGSSMAEIRHVLKYYDMDKSIILWSDLISVDISLYLYFLSLFLLGISVLSKQGYTQLLFHTFFKLQLIALLPYFQRIRTLNFKTLRWLSHYEIAWDHLIPFKPCCCRFWDQGLATILIILTCANQSSDCSHISFYEICM